MSEDKVVSFRKKDEIDDPLTEILRAGAQRLIEQTVEGEFAAFLGSHADLELPEGRQRVVRHGHDPIRPIQTGIGPVEVGATSYRPHEGRALARHGASHGLQAGDGGGEKLATPARPKSVAESRERCNIP
jgi:hypothetical protein